MKGLEVGFTDRLINSMILIQNLNSEKLFWVFLRLKEEYVI